MAKDLRVVNISPLKLNFAKIQQIYKMALNYKRGKRNYFTDKGDKPSLIPKPPRLSL